MLVQPLDDASFERPVRELLIRRLADMLLLFVHDIPNACLAGLDRFRTRIEDGGFSFEQQFPDRVVITRNGRFVTLPAPFVADALPTRGQEPLS
jgi:hypothetical protein